MESAKMFTGIKTVITKGNGTGENPFLKVTQYWTLGGKLIGEREEVCGECNLELTPDQFPGEIR